MRRFFLNGTISETMELTGTDAHHIARVLRMAVGDNVIIADENERTAKAEITAITDEVVTLSLIEYLEDDSEPTVKVRLAQCLPKSDKMEFIVQKAVELGAVSIQPVNSENCVVKYTADKQAKRVERWQKIAHEAAKQCKRAAVPTVEPIITLKELLSCVDDDETVLFCYEAEDGRTLRQALNTHQSEKYTVLIGPEGGFSPEEARLCQEMGAHPVSLGSRILRTETASLAALTMVLYAHGELGGAL
ncbi:MAG: 16S rRNA (uracil(1498)-N(3))-methyltransferase [Selenomonadales bacterium]|nr:16S rRNA (uracil(1498)-N(3))-methyltransferase [Selenomonadales bacterium]